MIMFGGFYPYLKKSRKSRSKSRSRIRSRSKSKIRSKLRAKGKNLRTRKIRSKSK